MESANYELRMLSKVCRASEIIFDYFCKNTCSPTIILQHALTCQKRKEFTVEEQVCQLLESGCTSLFQNQNPVGS